MRKTFLPIAALLMLALLAMPASYGFAEGEASIDYTELYYYPVEDLSLEMYIASSWESLALETDSVFPITSFTYNDDGVPVSGSAVFYYLPDPEVVYAQETNEAANAKAIETGTGIAGVALHSIGGSPEEAGLNGYEYRLYTETELGAISVVWTDPSTIKINDADTLAALQAMVDSFRKDDLYIQIVEILPVSIAQVHTTDLDGNEFTHLDLAGAKLTLVNAWATYCSPCLEEMPDLGALAAEYADRGVRIIGIPVDIFDVNGEVDEDQLALAQRIVQQTGATYTHLIADGYLSSGLLSQVQYVPSSWFVDSEGNAVSDIIIGSMSKDDWASAIEQYLAAVE